MPKLFVVATPIGNLSDVSPRMRETLEGVGLIVAEDTRVTGSLLRRFNIAQKPLSSLHRHNEARKANTIVTRMLAEELDVALVTDAGTPAISDPGCLLVREAAEAGIEVLPIAGPSAVTAALSISGFDAREFAFYGFLPREQGDLIKKLVSIASGPKVAVLYESPHRVISLLEAVERTLPGCQTCVCCDLTKLYEKTLRGEAGIVLESLRQNPKAEKGEYCVVLDMEGVRLPETEPNAASLEAQLFENMLEGASVSEAVYRAVERGARKNDAKRAALRIRQWQEVHASESTDEDEGGAGE